MQKPYRLDMRVSVGTVEALGGSEAIVVLADGSKRTLQVPEWAKVREGLSVRIIESDDGEPDVTWGMDERAAELERISGYVRAKLRLLGTEEGGRKHPFVSGYRPQWDLGHCTEDGRVAFNDAEVWLEDELKLDPGSTAVVRLHPFFPEHWDVVGEGSVLGLYEGHRKLGEASVLEVVPAEDASAQPLD
jgi:hypothetical protein